MKEPAKKPAGKAAAAKDAPKKAPSTKTVKTKPANGVENGFSKPLKPSKELAAVVGDEPLARTVVVSRVWDYIRKNKLQNEANKREIIADEKLKAVFETDKVTMFEMNKHLARHLKS